MSEAQVPAVQPPHSAGDYPHALQQEFTIAIDLINNALRLCADAKVGLGVVANVLLSQAAIIAATHADGGDYIIRSVEQNFRAIVAVHRANLREMTKGAPA